MPGLTDIPVDQMTARIDQITNAGTYGGAVATGIAAALNWLSANQSGLTVLAMLLTAGVTVISALYGIYHRHQIRRIAARQGFESLRRSDL
jgi:hypothetical protein